MVLAQDLTLLAEVLAGQDFRLLAVVPMESVLLLVETDQILVCRLVVVPQGMVCRYLLAVLAAPDLKYRLLVDMG